MTCNRCGAAIEAGEEFCGKCGAPVKRSQPDREAIRVRAQGGGRHAAPRRGPVMPEIDLSQPQDQEKLFCLAAGVLGLLQILYLLIKTLFVSFGTESYAVSVYTAVKESSGFLAVLLLLSCVAVLAGIAVPIIREGRPRILLTVGLSALMLVLYVIAVFAVRSSYARELLGVKPKLGFFGWMFLLNCLLIPALTWLAGGEPAPIPAAAAAPAAAAQPKRPVSTPHPLLERQAAPRRGVNGPAKPASVGRQVTPPDAETIAALRRMAQMHKEGLVSDEEFARIKAECAARGWIRE